jgi:putative ABC transport system permease protein
MRTLHTIGERLAQDVRYALRALRKTPTFTLIVTLTLGLGIGANAAIFSIINAVLLKPFPYPHADRLMMVWATNEKIGHHEWEFSIPDFEDSKAQNQSFDAIAAFSMRGSTLARGDHSERVPGIEVTAGFFEMLGAAPALGRTFQPGDDAPDARVAILSDGLWRHQFGSRADILGQTIRVNQQPYTIVGVMRPDFDFATRAPDEHELYRPLVRESNRGHQFVQVLARLRPGVSIAQAQADMDVITRRLAAQYPETNAGIGANIVPLAHTRVGKFRIRLFIFMGIVGLVLLIACTNVANLLLARNMTRQKELAVRAALGAGRWRLLQQLVTESLVLAIAGGALGVLIATWMGPLLAAYLAEHFPIARIENTHTDAWVLAFTFGIALATVLLFGAVHAQSAASTRDLQESLRASGRSATEGVRGARLRRGLVIAEVALALVLLAGAGSLVKSLVVMTNTEPGLTVDGVLTTTLLLPRTKLVTPDDRLRYARELLDRVGALPEVRSAALVTDLPLSGNWSPIGFRIAGRANAAPVDATVNTVSPDYFRTLGIPIKAGRGFTAQDTPNAPGVVVIDEAAARRYWPGGDPIGAQIVLNQDQPIALTVVGVVGDVRQRDLEHTAPPQAYVNGLQQTGMLAFWQVLIVRTAVDPASAATHVMRVAQSIDRDVPFMKTQTLEAVLQDSLDPPRVYTSLLGAFAGLALLLAAVGLYGVMSYVVTQRTQEMGIRMALGATSGDVIRLVLRQALTLIGAAIGIGGALAVSRLLAYFISTAQPSDPVTLIAVSLVLLAAAFLASYAPARRGSRVDPISAVRNA